MTHHGISIHFANNIRTTSCPFRFAFIHLPKPLFKVWVIFLPREIMTSRKSRTIGKCTWMIIGSMFRHQMMQWISQFLFSIIGMSIKHQFMHFKWLKGEIPGTFITCILRNTTLSNNMHSSPRLTDLWSDFFYISWRLIIKLIRRESLFLWYSFTFTVVITHEIITSQAICMDKIPKDFTSIKDTYYAAFKNCTHSHASRSLLGANGGSYILSSILFKLQFP